MRWLINATILLASGEILRDKQCAMKLTRKSCDEQVPPCTHAHTSELYACAHIRTRTLASNVDQIIWLLQPIELHYYIWDCTFSRYLWMHVYIWVVWYKWLCSRTLLLLLLLISCTYSQMIDENPHGQEKLAWLASLISSWKGRVWFMTHPQNMWWVWTAFP